MKTIIQILGPTGVGKSSLSFTLAQHINGEIISADSMQVYQGFDIGTDKITLAQRLTLPHHLIDILSDCSQFNASIFLEKSFTAAEDIIKRGKIPLVCGGTALYLRIMMKGIFPESQHPRISRQKLEHLAENCGLERLFKRLAQVDPEYAAKIGPNDRIRILRALEIFYNNGSPPTEIFNQTQTPFENYQFIRIGLNTEREELYQRINRRVDLMIENGLINEVQELLKRYPINCPPFKSLGYKEILMYLDGQLCLQKAIDLIKQNSRNFAKRQLSWFRQEKNILWFTPDQQPQIENYIRKSLSKQE